MWSSPRTNAITWQQYPHEASTDPSVSHQWVVPQPHPPPLSLYHHRADQSGVHDMSSRSPTPTTDAYGAGSPRQTLSITPPQHLGYHSPGNTPYYDSLDSPQVMRSPVQHTYQSHSPAEYRSVSPAVSTITASSSSNPASTYHGSPPFSQTTPMMDIGPSTQGPSKQRKQRLFNIDRKDICRFADKYPDCRQEDIAIRFHVERSTVSKILKHKDRWLSVPDQESIRIAKHRPSKFPEIENRMVEWLHEHKDRYIPDSAIRAAAKGFAVEFDIDNERFKASSGWIENFKSRHGVRQGHWGGLGLNTKAARALGKAKIHVSSPSSVVLPSMRLGPSSASDADYYMHPPSPRRPGSSSMSVVPYPSPGPAMVLPPIPIPPPPAQHLASTPPPPLEVPDGRSHHYHSSESYQTSPQASYYATEVYAPVPEIPDNTTVPTMDQAENHINKLLLFFKSPDGGKNILTPEELESLVVIKKALFQAAGGIRVRT